MKIFHRTKRVAIAFGIIISLLLSCYKDEFVETYRVTIQNDYFEPIDSVTIGVVDFGTIKTEEFSQTKDFSPGSYIFHATSIGLAFESTVTLRGLQPNVLLIFDANGKLLHQKYFF